MNLKHKLSFLALVCCVCLGFSLPMHAKPLPKDIENVERVPVGAAADSQKPAKALVDAQQNAEQRAPQAEQEKVFTKPLFETSHPAAFYSLYNVLPYDHMLELHDRSLWKICPGYSVIGWLPSDYITISPSGFADFKYCLTNQRRSEFVYVNLHLGPDYRSDDRMKINSIFIDGRGMLRITVKDGLGRKSEWTMSGYDYNKVSRWRKGQTVMIGLNTDVNAEGSNILINVNTNNFASGTCIGY